MEELHRLKAGGRYLGVMQLAQELLHAPERLTDREGVEVAGAGLAAAMALEEYFRAAVFADAELRWAEATGDPDLVASATYHVGTVALHAGDSHTALERLGQYLVQAQSAVPEIDRHTGACYFNIGVAHLQRRLYRDAVSMFLAARTWFEQHGRPHDVIKALLEAAWAESLGGRPEPAGHYLEQVQGLLAEEPDASLQTVSLCHRALYHSQLHELSEALELVQEVLIPGRPGVTPHNISEAAWIGGECALQLGHLREARGFVALALDEAVKAKWPTLMNRAADLRRRIHEAEQQPA